MQPRPDTTLSHLERERSAQRARAAVVHVQTADLRKLRAWLLDVVQGERTAHMDLATLRGEVVHERILQNERKRTLTAIREFANPTDRRLLVALATFADLSPPETLTR